MKTQSQPTHATDLKSKPQATWLLVLITSTSILATAIIAPSLPGIAESFSVTPKSAQWVLTAYLMMIALGQLIFGPISDRFGRRLPLFAGLTLYLFGSISAFLSPNLETLILARCIQGLGASAAMVLPRVMINDTHTPRAAAASLAAVTAAMALTPMISFPFGGVLFELVGWRGSMAAMVLMGIITIVPSLLLLHETNMFPQRHLSLSLVIPGYMLLLKNRQFLLFATNLGLQVSIFYSFLNFLPFAFQKLGYSAAEFGAYIALLPVGFIAGNLLSRQLTPVFGITKMVRTGSTLTVLAVTLMAGLAFLGFHSAWPLIAPAMIYSLSNGLTLPNASIGALIAAGRSAQGFGSGLAGSLQMLLGSTIATTTIFLGAAHDTRIGITVVLVVAISAFMTSLFLVENAQES